MIKQSVERRPCALEIPWRVLVAVVAFLSVGTPAGACDLCAIYTATEQRESRTGVWLGAAEQFSSYNTLQVEGHQVENPAGERLNSFITQFLVGYNFTPRLGLQLNLPVIGRSFRRQEANGIVNGDETGIGDMSLIGSFAAYSDVTEQSVIRWTLLGGLKLPSGNSHRLKEELSEPQSQSTADLSAGAVRARPLHEIPIDTPTSSETDSGAEVMSGIHGHDLALGSGSTDGVIGTQVFASWQRAFVSAAVQYALRTEGSFGYTYANDLIWNGGPGVFAFLTHEYTVMFQAVVSGESKSNDSLNGVSATDTAITALYAGPGVSVTYGTTLGADIEADLPAFQHNSALQAVPDYRIRGGVTWRF